ncbi:hypothetical protein PLICRDRAFT_181694 [Plicaturopsis crispa FD-325 SS-3]|nr:hypothetical protein PLICRDRAFT_181694 [Plicaturopsis crispa FD-325 SS-3]
MRKHPGFALDIKLDPKLASILGLVRRLVERCAASSPDTMADLTAALRAVLGDLPAERILAFLARALAVPGPGTKSTRAAQDARRHTAAPQGKRTEPLAGPAYVASPQGARAVGALYDEVVAIYGEGAAIYSGVDANAPLDANALHGESGGVNVGNNANATSESTKAAARLHTLRTRAAHFAHALATDRALVDLVQSLTALAHDLADLSTDIASGNWQTRLARTSQSNLADVVAWLLPRLLRVLPMPRAELRTPTLDAALDSLFATADGAGVSPDCVVVRNWSEVRVDMGGSGLDSAQGDEGEEGYGGGGVEGESGDERGGTRVHTTHRIHIHVDGVRLAARGVAYYVAYKGLVPYTDEGLLSVDVGPGASVDVEIGLDSSSTSHIPSTTSSSPENENENDEEPEPAHPLYTVHAVHVSLPALAVRIRRSRHWLLNALLVQPLAAPVVRRVLAAQVRSALEGGARVGGEVVREAHAHETSASGDRNGDKEGDGAGDGRVGWWDYWTAALKVLGGGEGEDEVKTESRTEAHLNGVTHVVEAEGGEETVLALGMGAQILPGKGGPHGDEGPPTLGDVVDEAAEEVIRGVGEAVDVAERVHVREFVEHAGERLEERTLAEDGRAGWRSAAFDF